MSALYLAPSYAEPQKIEDDELDQYAKRGVVLARDAAHRCIAALERDAYEMESRGGRYNQAGAEENRALAANIINALGRI